MLTRRSFIKLTAAGMLALYVRPPGGGMPQVFAQAAIPGGTLLPGGVPKYQTPLLIPPAMPRAGQFRRGRQLIDYYEIGVRQFAQQILPASLPATTVWGYGPIVAPNGPQIFNAPSLTIEANWQTPVRVKWVNELVDANGNYLPHLLPVDPTLHWANPPGGKAERDMRPTFTATPGPYTGPVPMVTHVHGSVGVGDESDGYTEAWYLPKANNIPAGYADEGAWYNFFKVKAALKGFRAPGRLLWEPGTSVFQYPNIQRASTIWYHDHSLGLTRLNVYAGPAGFFLIRGGPGDDVRDSRTGKKAKLPGPAPARGDKAGKRYYEIPIAIQDRSFNADGSLFYPNSREFFDGILGDYIPHGEFAPIWNPEFFGNMMMINGNTWPYQVVERRRYRLRFLNGCQSRFLILDFSQIPGVEVWMIGNEGGFLAAPVNITADHQNRILMGLAERADVIVDFTNVPEGNYVLGNVGPDEPFRGGAPDVDDPENGFPVADPDSTGQIMQFRVVPIKGRDKSTPPQFLSLPAIAPVGVESVTRKLAMIEKMGMGYDDSGPGVEGPVEALLGTVGPDSIDPNLPPGVWAARMWMEPITENPDVGAVEMWELYNTTGDAHPMHVHEVVFEVVDRQDIVVDELNQTVTLGPESTKTGPEPWETGFKDTVTAYPGQVTRIRALFDTRGQFVWHCHIVEHEDNEMMRPYRVGPPQFGQPGFQLFGAQSEAETDDVQAAGAEIEEEFIPENEQGNTIFMPFVANQ